MQCQAALLPPDSVTGLLRMGIGSMFMGATKNSEVSRTLLAPLKYYEVIFKLYTWLCTYK